MSPVSNKKEERSVRRPRKLKAVRKENSFDGVATMWSQLSSSKDASKDDLGEQSAGSKSARALPQVGESVATERNNQDSEYRRSIRMKAATELQVTAFDSQLILCSMTDPF